MQRWDKRKCRHFYVQGRNKVHVLNRSHLTDFVSVLNHWFRCLRHLAMNTATDNSSLRSSYKSQLLLGSSVSNLGPVANSLVWPFQSVYVNSLVLIYLNINLKYYNNPLPNWDISNQIIRRHIPDDMNLPIKCLPIQREEQGQENTTTLCIDLIYVTQHVSALTTTHHQAF